MFIDAREIEDKQIQADICIIGAGAAGITLARELAKKKELSIILLESGGFEFDKETNELNVAEEAGNVTEPEDKYLESSRLRYFGGTTNHWRGWCRPLDKMDFEKRPWIPHTGWPISKKDLDPYYERAYPIVEIKDFNYKVPEASSEQKPVVIKDSKTVITKTLHRSTPTRFGKKYREELDKAENVKVYTYANVTELLAHPSGNACRYAKVATLKGNQFEVKANHFILATGGIENVRILLHSTSVQNNGLGNDNDLVGRFFMDHLETRLIAKIASTNPNVGYGFYFKLKNKILDQVIYPAFTPSPELQQKEGLLNCSVYVSPKFRDKNKQEPFWTNLSAGLSEIDAPEIPKDKKRTGLYLGTFKSRSEQTPNPNSRITLSEEKDAIGMQRIKLDWNILPEDRLSTRRFLEVLANELGRLGEGRLKITMDEINPDNKVLGGFHHMGTTRMGENIKLSVVDKNCKVHSVDNLYIAGSSVFPACGFANPTLTITALALRLADHLKAKVA